MPNSCSVANCSSNYDSTNYTPVFEMLNHIGQKCRMNGEHFSIEKNAKTVRLPNFPSYLQGSSEYPDRLDRDEIDIRHFHQALELSRAEHRKVSAPFLFLILFKSS